MKAFSAHTSNVSFSLIVLALGAGQFTLKHLLPDIQRLGFRAIDLLHALDIFSNLSIAGMASTYDHWVASLKAEHSRAIQIDKTLEELDHPWETRLLKAGCRIGFPVFYMFYDKLRDHLDKGPFKEWAIYSGRNNPVMNWQNGWITLGSENNALELYWEFNWQSFCLKGAIEEKTAKRWVEVRPMLIELCVSCPVRGRKTADKHGASVTAYKWDFNFCKETPSAIARKTNDILSHVHKHLHTFP